MIDGVAAGSCLHRASTATRLSFGVRRAILPRQRGRPDVGTLDGTGARRQRRPQRGGGGRHDPARAQHLHRRHHPSLGCARHRRAAVFRLEHGAVRGRVPAGRGLVRADGAAARRPRRLPAGPWRVRARLRRLRAGAGDAGAARRTLRAGAWRRHTLGALVHDGAHAVPGAPLAACPQRGLDGLGGGNAAGAGGRWGIRAVRRLAPGVLERRRGRAAAACPGGVLAAPPPCPPARAGRASAAGQSAAPLGQRARRLGGQHVVRTAQQRGRAGGGAGRVRGVRATRGDRCGAAV
jgi:hypothetical protein